MIRSIDAILTNLKNSSSIESEIRKTFKEVRFPLVSYSKENHNLPLFNKEFYKLINELKRMPSNIEYINYYIEKNFPSVEGENLIALKTAAHYAYTAFVKEIHFYFLLKESGIFDDVEMNLLYDIFGKADILIKYNDQSIGLQLYDGDIEHTQRKLLQQSEGKFHCDFNVYLFPYELSQKKIVTTENGARFKFYSKNDITFIQNLFSEKHQYDVLSEHQQKTPAKRFINKKENIRDITLPIPNNIKVNNKIRGTKTSSAIDFSSNNQSQQKAIIDHVKANIIVNAGAGSGKTHTMISRILYLLENKEIESLSEVVMITFTNEATNSMKEKLQKRFIEHYKTTKNIRFLRYLEELPSMKIMTIHSFARNIISKFGHLIGYGTEFKISSGKKQRKDIISKSLHEIINSNNIKINSLNIEFYELVKIVNEVWNKQNGNGLIEKDIQSISVENYPNSLEFIIYNTILLSEKKFNELKIQENYLETDDLIRYLRLLNVKSVPWAEINKEVKYIFVDEFQDTDKAQIEFVSQLAIKANIPLFVVGDVKQSIYKFRGADYNAFDILKRKLQSSSKVFSEHTLTQNYRTSSVLINKIENIFDRWRKYDYLPETSSRMTSNLPSIYQDPLIIENLGKRAFPREIFLHYNEMTQKHKYSKEIPVLSVLTRTNKQAIKIGEALEKQNDSGVIVQVNKEGTLFTSEAARDLLILLNSWIFNEKYYLFNLSQTRFVSSSNQLTFNKSEDYYIPNQTFEFQIPEPWFKAKSGLQVSPPFEVLTTFLNATLNSTDFNNRFLNNHLNLIQYKRNIYKIIELMNSRLEEEINNLWTLKQWLQIQIATNTEEDEAEIDYKEINQPYIRIMTVHKSKGLEFDTVVIPYTLSPFNSDIHDTKVIVQEDKENIKVGWRAKKRKNNQVLSVTENYKDLLKNESLEQLKEETRLLYVALTRAKQKIVVYGIKRTKFPPENWNDLIKMNGDS